MLTPMNNEHERTLAKRFWELLWNNLEEGLQARSRDEIIEDFLDAGVDIRPDLESIAKFNSLPIEELEKLSEADFRNPSR